MRFLPHDAKDIFALQGVLYDFLLVVPNEDIPNTVSSIFWISVLDMLLPLGVFRNRSSSLHPMPSSTRIPVSAQLLLVQLLQFLYFLISLIL